MLLQLPRELRDRIWCMVLGELPDVHVDLGGDYCLDIYPCTSVWNTSELAAHAMSPDWNRLNHAVFDYHGSCNNIKHFHKPTPGSIGALFQAPLLLTNRQTAKEVKPLLFSNRTFLFHDFIAANKFSHCIGPNNSKAVKHTTIFYAVGPPLPELIV